MTIFWFFINSWRFALVFMPYWCLSQKGMVLNMKTVILAGGYGTRISEESHLKPKPMIEIGDKPIIWHIMKIYSHYGFNDFVICCGYRGYMIKEYFVNYFLYNSDITVDFSNENQMQIHSHNV